MNTEKIIFTTNQIIEYEFETNDHYNKKEARALVKQINGFYNQLTRLSREVNSNLELISFNNSTNAKENVIYYQQVLTDAITFFDNFINFNPKTDSVFKL